MLGKLTDAELAAMPAKTKMDPITVALYQEHEFLTAYALHTDRRIEITGYKSAVGADEHNWDSHGELQRAFLIDRGLLPHHRLLEVGCGTGRLARKITPYLEVGNYHGIDISNGALEAAAELSGVEGWAARLPAYSLGAVPDGTPAFDFAWAFSVFIHLPREVIQQVMANVASVLAPAGVFYWSYVPEQRNWRSGVKQFRATRDVYMACARAAGLTFEEVPNWISVAGYTPGRWSGGQLVACSHHRGPVR